MSLIGEGLTAVLDRTLRDHNSRPASYFSAVCSMGQLSVYA